MKYTVRELELIIENRNLRAELQFAKSKVKDRRFVEMLTTPDLIEMSDEMVTNDLLRVAEINSRIDYGKRHVIGWAQTGSSHDQKYTFNYFLSESQALDPKERIRQLGHMHEVFINKAVAYIQREYGTPAFNIEELKGQDNE